MDPHGSFYEWVYKRHVPIIICLSIMSRVRFFSRSYVYVRSIFFLLRSVVSHMRMIMMVMVVAAMVVMIMI